MQEGRRVLSLVFCLLFLSLLSEGFILSQDLSEALGLSNPLIAPSKKVILAVDNFDVNLPRKTNPHGWVGVMQALKYIQQYGGEYRIIKGGQVINASANADEGTETVDIWLINTPAEIKDNRVMLNVMGRYTQQEMAQDPNKIEGLIGALYLAQVFKTQGYMNYSPEQVTVYTTSAFGAPVKEASRMKVVIDIFKRFNELGVISFAPYARDGVKELPGALSDQLNNMISVNAQRFGGDVSGAVINASSELGIVQVPQRGSDGRPTGQLETNTGNSFLVYAMAASAASWDLRSGEEIRMVASNALDETGLINMEVASQVAEEIPRDSSVGRSEPVLEDLFQGFLW